MEITTSGRVTVREMTAEQIVTAMIDAIERKDLDAAVGYMSDDIEYDNVPMGKVFGPDGVRQALEPFLARYGSVEWRILHQVASDDVVMNERIDRFEASTGWVEIAVVGLFEVVDGKVRLWRDYFDLAAATSALSQR